MNATTKTILIEDWYAPEFRVRIIPPRSCPLPLKRRRYVSAPLFPTTHLEPWRPGTTREFRRRSRFTALSRA